MGTLIDRDALYAKIQPVDFLYGHDEAAPYSGMAVDAGDIESAPTVEAAPVVHAHWEYIGADKRGRAGIWKCSNRSCLYPYKTDYCPHCGAKMDERGNQ